MYTYKEVIDKIENSRRFGNLPGVEVTRRMLAALGNPQEGLRFIHVAGTNGKGSTCAFLTNIFTQAGLKCGCFTSPPEPVAVTVPPVMVISETEPS